jgi:hypothetical protein
MARADTITLIPLDRAAFHLGIDPYHFNSVFWADNPATSTCDDEWYQFNWQNTGKLSREALASALAQAEQAAEDFLHWSPVPRWRSEEWVLPEYYKTEYFNVGNSQRRAKSLFTKWGYVIEAGVRASTYISSPATVFSDPDGDLMNELVTITFATTVTDEEELRVYYPLKNGDDRWEIRPLLSVDITAGVATITFPKYLIALENLLNAIPTPDNPHIGIDATDDTQFLATVDVYRVYTDVSDQITFYYESDACAHDCDSLTYTGCLRIREPRLGTLAYTPATWNATTGTFALGSFNYVPTKVKINYRAGWMDSSMLFPTREMNPTYERLIVYYALSLLDTELCGCDNTKNIWQHMTRDLALDDGNRRYSMPWNKMGNPFGTTFGALRLWEAIQPLKINRSSGVGL